jgi:hypothetical protein
LKAPQVFVGARWYLEKMRRGMIAAGVLASWAIVSSGCLDFGDLSGGGASDASDTDVEKSVNADASSISDGSTTILDGGQDATPFCDQLRSGLVFCDEFSNADASTGWSGGTAVDFESRLDVEDVEFVSAPSALYISADYQGLETGTATLNQLWSGASGTTINFEFQLFIDQIGATDDIMFRLTFADDRGVDFTCVGGGSTSATCVVAEEYADDSGSPESSDLALTLPIALKTWTHVHASIDLSTNKIVFGVDGTTPQTVTFPSRLSTASVVRSLDFGSSVQFEFNSSPDTWNTYLDDLLVNEF